MLKRKWNALTSRNVFKINDKFTKPPSKLFAWTMIFVGVFLVIFGFIFINGQWQEFFSSFSQLGETLKEMIAWDFRAYATPNLFGDTFFAKAFTSLQTTIIMSFAGTIIGVAFAIPVAMLSSNNIVHNKFVNNTFKTILAILRTIPAFTFALILIGYFGQTTLSVTIAVAIFTFSITGKLFLERIEHINFKIYAAIQATGASKPRAFRTAVIPQISHNILSITFYSLETNIRYIAIVGGMSSVGLGELIQNNINLQNWDKAGFLLFLLILVVLVLEILIYVIKKFILKDRDFILDKKDQDEILHKVKRKLAKSNLSFYLSEVVKANFSYQNQSWKEKLTTWKRCRQAVKAFKQEHKEKLAHDKMNFNNVQKTEVNSKKWFVYNEKISQEVRLDKIYLTNFNIKVEKMKSELYLESKQELSQQHEKFLKSLTVEKVYKKAPLKWIKRTVFYLVLLALFAYSMSTISYRLESKEVIAATNSNLAKIFNISWASLFSATDIAPYSVLYLLFETLSIAIVGTVVGAIFAFFLGLISSETIVNVYVAKVFVIITSILRAIPTYIYAIIFVSLVGLGPFNGAIALAMGSAGMLTKYNRELFEDVNLKVTTQLQATGLNAWERFRYGIMPQTTSGIVSYIIYRFDINFKEVSSLGIVGAGTMGYLLNTYFNDHYYSEFGALLLGIIVFTLFVEVISTIVRNKINLGINPQFVDKIILWVKNKNWVVYRATESMVFQTTNLSYDEARAFYAYTNQELFKLVAQLKKAKHLSLKAAYHEAYCQMFKQTLSDYEAVKNHEQAQLQMFKQQRKAYLEELITNYTTEMTRLKTNLKANLENLDNKDDAKIFKKEFKKTRVNAHRILQYKKSSLT